MEAFAFEAIVVFFVEAVFDGGTGAFAGGVVIDFGEDLVVLHYAGEVMTVEFDFEDGLVEVLNHFGHEIITEEP